MAGELEATAVEQHASRHHHAPKVWTWKPNPQRRICAGPRVGNRCAPKYGGHSLFSALTDTGCGRTAAVHRGSVPSPSLHYAMPDADLAHEDTSGGSTSTHSSRPLTTGQLLRLFLRTHLRRFRTPLRGQIKRKKLCLPCKVYGFAGLLHLIAGLILHLTCFQVLDLSAHSPQLSASASTLACSALEAILPPSSFVLHIASDQFFLPLLLLNARAWPLFSAPRSNVGGSSTREKEEDESARREEEWKVAASLARWLLRPAEDVRRAVLAFTQQHRPLSHFCTAPLNLNHSTQHSTSPKRKEKEKRL
eukprot:1992957-Rhodomonas_salina.1